MIYLTLDHICEFNRYTIARYGGLYIAKDKNLRNRNSLEYILVAIEQPIFGHELFPTLIDKAAALAWWIIEGHVYYDGNKRTGMQAAMLLLRINDEIPLFDNNTLVEVSVAIANRDLDLQQLTLIMGRRTFTITP